MIKNKKQTSDKDIELAEATMAQLRTKVSGMKHKVAKTGHLVRKIEEE